MSTARRAPAKPASSSKVTFFTWIEDTIKPLSIYPSTRTWKMTGKLWLSTATWALKSKQLSNKQSSTPSTEGPPPCRSSKSKMKKFTTWWVEKYAILLKTTDFFTFRTYKRSNLAPQKCGIKQRNIYLSAKGMWLLRLNTTTSATYSSTWPRLALKATPTKACQIWTNVSGNSYKTKTSNLSNFETQNWLGFLREVWPSRPHTLWYVWLRAQPTVTKKHWLHSNLRREFVKSKNRWPLPNKRKKLGLSCH